MNEISGATSAARERVYGCLLEYSGDFDRLSGLADSITNVMCRWAWPDLGERTEWRDGTKRDGDRIVGAMRVVGDRSLHRITVGSGWESEDETLTHVSCVQSWPNIQVGVSVEARGGSAAAGSAAVAPTLVADLVALGASVGMTRLDPLVRVVQGRHEVGDLVEELQATERTLPYLVFTSTSGTGRYALGDEDLVGFARRVAGVARVIALARHQDTFELGDRLGKDLTVFGGAVRLYWPGLTLGVHPVYLRERVNPYVFQGIESHVVRAALTRYRPPDSAVELLGQYRREQEQAKMAARLAGAANAQEKVLRYEKEVKGLLEERAELERVIADRDAALREHSQRIVHLEGSLTRLEQQVSRLTIGGYQEAVLKAEARRELAITLLGDLEGMVDRLRLETAPPVAQQVEDGVPTDDEVAPRDYEEALLMAMEMFPGTLDITGAAERSVAKMNSADVPVWKLWHALKAMDLVVGRWQRDDLPALGMAAAFQELGFELKRVSPTALGEHKHEYFFTHEGRWMHVDQHIKLSRGERIYWALLEDQRRFVLNHIGSHLPDGTTG